MAQNYVHIRGINKKLDGRSSLPANELSLFVAKLIKHGRKETQNIIMRGRSEPWNGAEELPGAE
jgi:hypothetical protein